MIIKSSSEQHTKEHNVILEDDFNHNDLKVALRESLLDEENILCAIKPKPLPDFLKNETEEISRNVRYGIYLTNERPFIAGILTSSEKEQEYLENRHYEGITASVIIRRGQTAIDLINKLYKEFELARMRDE